MGDIQSGKSAIAKQLVSDGTNYPKNYLMTHAVELSVKDINIPDTNDVVELYLIDCSGREVYREMLAESVWADADLLVAVYDVTREDTFDSIRDVSILMSNDKKLLTHFLVG